MSKPPKLPFNLPSIPEGGNPLVHEALAWLTHLHSGDETTEDWASFQDWKTLDDAHSEAAEKAERLWEHLGPALLQETKARGRGLPIIVAAAIGLPIIAFAAGVFGPPASYFADYRSGTGEIRSVTLRDGSRVDLDTATSFDMGLNGRTLILYTGQVFVAVKSDPANPFTVIAGDERVQALGTAFAVRRDSSAARVVVSEHAVRVTSGRDGTNSKEVSVGQSLTISVVGTLGDVSSVDVAALTAWRRGEVTFDGRPLGEVIEEISRYRRGKVVLLDDSVRGLAVTGSFDVRDTDAFFESIQLGLPVRVVRLPGLAIIRRDTSRPMPTR